MSRPVSPVGDWSSDPIETRLLSRVKALQRPIEVSCTACLVVVRTFMCTSSSRVRSSSSVVSDDRKIFFMQHVGWTSAHGRSTKYCPCELDTFVESVQRGEGFLDPDPEGAEGIPKGLPFHWLATELLQFQLRKLHSWALTSSWPVIWASSLVLAHTHSAHVSWWT